MLTVSDSEDYLFEAIRHGAHGYLLKDLRPEQLYDLLRAVMRNETPLSPAIAGKILAEFRGKPNIRQAPTAEPEGPALTRREIEILQLVADGLSNKEIGTELVDHRGDGQEPRPQRAREAPPREPDPGRRLRRPPGAGAPARGL